MDRISIEIPNWRKWQPRADIKNPTWFAIANDLLDNPEFHDFSPLEFHALLYIFSQASRRNKDMIDLIFAHAETRNIKKAILLSTLEKLERIQCVRITRTDTYATDRQTDTTDITNTTQQTRQAAPLFDRAYEKYPIRVKGQNAEQRFKQQIKTEDDERELHQALDNYRAMLSLPENSWRRPKQTFAAFLGTKASGFYWRDFINWEPPALASPSTDDYIERLIKEREEREAREAREAV